MNAIGLGDLVTATRRLATADPEVLRQVASLLGFEWPLAPEPPAALEPPPTEPLPLGAEPTQKPVPPVEAAPVVPMPQMGPLFDSFTTIEPLEDAPLRTPVWLKGVAPMAPPSAAPGSLPLEPLFASATSRHLLTTALRTPSGEGPPDVEVLIQVLSRGEPVRTFPSQELPTLSRGVHVLVDKGEGMQPFTRDQRELLAQLRRVVGSERVSSTSFIGLPGRRTPRGRALVLPPRGTPLLLLTDLGLGGPAYSSSRASLDEWMALARKWGATGHPLVAFVPYPPSRWPRELTKLIRIVQWDRHTTVGRVLSASARPRRRSW
ncbi:hypothetical protein [Hyalangium versicolor]|uniref:hypothetical protein n=1 Tax=Hyalangium versicolor TaxID=2861190 RepID=UPI001CCF1EAE|nr:hypothetical protein [Hyalangium versicolor]